MPCFEPPDRDFWGVSALARAFRVSLQQGALQLSARLLEIPLRNVFETPWLVWFHIVHLLHPSGCQCLVSFRNPGKKLGFGEEVLETLAVICFAPHFVPQRLWHTIAPRPCHHRRCALRNYVSPPLPWHRRLRSSLAQSIQATCSKLRLRRSDKHQPKPFPIFRLPVEIRNLIYLHASSVRKHEVRVTGPWTTSDLQDSSYTWATTSTTTSEYDARCHHRGHEDATSYQLNNDAVIAYHGTPPPPTNILLVCKQMYEEVQDQFLSTTAFEVQPLTPDDASWRLDYSLIPTYDALARSMYAPFMRKILVRIDLARFCMSRRSKRFSRATAQVCTFRELQLEECVERLSLLAEKLCSVLRKSVPNLKVVEIHWIDDFPDAVEACHLELRKKILLPFVDIDDVQTRIGKLVMADEGRLAVQTMAKHVLWQSP